MVERGVCELAHSFFLLMITCFEIKTKRKHNTGFLYVNREDFFNIAHRYRLKEVLSLINSVQFTNYLSKLIPYRSSYTGPKTI